MSLRISFAGIDLDALESTFGLHDAALLRRACEKKRRSVCTVLKYIISGSLTRRSGTVRPANPKKKRSPWRLLFKRTLRFNPFRFFHAIERFDRFSEERGFKNRIIMMGYGLWALFTGLLWSSVLLIPALCLLIYAGCIYLEEKIGVVLGWREPRRKMISIKSWMMRSALWSLIFLRGKQPLQPPMLLRYPTGIKWLGFQDYVNSLSSIDARTTQLLEYITGARRFFEEEGSLDDDEDYYGYLTHDELIELVDAFTRYPEMMSNETETMMATFFLQVAEKGMALWYTAV